MKFVSLFSGAMGLDLGIEQAGFESAVCVENNSAAVETIKLNRPKLPVVSRSILEVSGHELRKLGKFRGTIPLVIGGPPCQAFSVFGNRKGLEDSRGQLIFEFIRIVSELNPDVFVMENVRGLLSMPVIPKGKKKIEKGKEELALPGSLLKLVFEKFNSIGYRVDCYVVNSVNYGAPQIRERLIFVGNRHNLLSHFFNPQFSNRKEDNLPTFKTLGDVIGEGFTDPCPEVMNFSERKLKYLAMIPPGGNWRSLPVDLQKESMGKSWHLKGGRSAYWRKLSFAFPSPTVVTMPNHAGTSMCHPIHLRAITVGEAAAIQEFPNKWIFFGTTAEKFRQIGNAVPIRLGKIAGESVSDLLRRIAKNEQEQNNIPPYRIIHLRPHVRTRVFWKKGTAFAGDHCYYEDKQIPLNL